MSSIVESQAKELADFDPEALWGDGEVFVNHPRVRLARLGDRRLTVHRHGDDAPSGLGVLMADPGLAAVAGLRFAGRGIHVMDFVEGDPLDSVVPDAAIAELMAQTMVALWRRPSGGLPGARRERPVVGPITQGQYVGMPDAVLASAYEHEPVVAAILRGLDQRELGLAVIHGDLKADNVIRTDDGGLRLIDWECCGAGHPEDDVASLLASMCVFGLGRAVRNALVQAEGQSLAEHCAQELKKIRTFSNVLLEQLRREAPEVSTEQLGAAFLVSILCRLQGMLFVPSSEALKLTTSEFVRRSMQHGPEAVCAWLRGDEAATDRGTQR